ncbi:hypothetical protein FACS1894162_2150 [Bacteroidia bacterium]|nr:hypothetical protein FACS1894162_2150 [Bacteroidia bacterium]
MPEGGDKDLTPPRFVGSTPAPNAIHFDKNKISLEFDEYISLEKQAENVIVTPPQKKAPLIKAVGKKITVELKDTLIPNTTYTFDFTNGIVDFNEKNVLAGFSFAVSTGDVVDTMMISGLLLNAENLEPMPHVLVGIHSDLSDTAFTRLPFLRTSQTNGIGQFRIRNVTPGTYHLFALDDKNRDFRFDNAGEAIAFDDSLIVPTFIPALRMDTIWKDSLTVDTIMEIHYNRFLPDDVILRLFQEDFSTQYLSKTTRPNHHQVVMEFNAPVSIEEIPTISAEAILEQSPDRKTMTWWLTDTLVYRQDTLQIVADYCASDTLNQLMQMTDTFTLVAKKAPAPKLKKGEVAKPEKLDITVAPLGTMDVFDTLRITFSEPLLDFPKEKIRFSQKIDTLWQPRDFPLVQDALNPRMYYVDTIFPYEQEYQIKIDTAALTGIYGFVNDSLQVNFKMKSEKDYAQLFVAVSDNDFAGFGQLLDGSQKVVKQSPLQTGEIVFYDIKPGKYFLRYIDDANGNGRWDTGNYAENCQPEAVYYYSGAFDLKAWVELEQNWNVKAIPIEQQKPLEITKNKPKDNNKNKK